MNKKDIKYDFDIYNNSENMNLVVENISNDQAKNNALYMSSSLAK